MLRDRDRISISFPKIVGQYPDYSCVARLAGIYNENYGIIAVRLIN